ncbi:MAG: hypothetical protein DME35_05395 [Verrucomicrobia bacterium]|nr:MAG: hypothetical protein DME35_05395 [Verrucomicrobiota bacterium]
MRRALQSRPDFVLLNGDDGADWDFSKEFSRRFAGQTNTAVGRGVIRHDAFVHSEVETAQPHEIRHLNLVNGRPMVAILIGNDVIATLGGIPVPTGRTGRIQNWHAISDERHVLRSERNFYAQMVGRRSAAEENLRSPPVSELGREIKRDHFITAGGTVAIGAGLQQRADVIGATQSGREHQAGNVAIVLNVIAKRLRRKCVQKFLVVFWRQSRVHVCAAVQQGRKQGRVIGSNRVGKQRNAFPFRRRRRNMFRKQQPH